MFNCLSKLLNLGIYKTWNKINIHNNVIKIFINRNSVYYWKYLIRFLFTIFPFFFQNVRFIYKITLHTFILPSLYDHEDLQLF